VNGSQGGSGVDVIVGVIDGIVVGDKEGEVVGD
jgi:hypothetical protein